MSLARANQKSAQLNRSSKYFQTVAKQLASKLQQRNRFWKSIARYIYTPVLIVFLSITIIKFVAYDHAKNKKNKKQMKTNLDQGILFLVLSVFILFFIIYFETY